MAGYASFEGGGLSLCGNGRIDAFNMKILLGEGNLKAGRVESIIHRLVDFADGNGSSLHVWEITAHGEIESAVGKIVRK